jgi:hypothetical protein
MKLLPKFLHCGVCTPLGVVGDWFMQFMKVIKMVFS